MKKTLVISILAVLFVLFSITTVFAAEDLASKIYEMGKPYGVTAEHKVEMERYFNTHPVSAEDEKYVIAKANEAIKIMEDNGVKDVTALSQKDLEKVQSIVKDAGNKIGVKVEFDGNKVKLNDKESGNTFKELVFSPEPGETPKTSSSDKKYVYTGDKNTTVGFTLVSIVLIAIGGATVVNLRKNA